MIVVVRLEFAVINGGDGGNIKEPPWRSSAQGRPCQLSHCKNMFWPLIDLIWSDRNLGAAEIAYKVLLPSPLSRAAVCSLQFVCRPAWMMPEGEDYPTMTCCSATRTTTTPHHTTPLYQPFSESNKYQAVGPGPVECRGVLSPLPELSRQLERKCYFTVWFPIFGENDIKKLLISWGIKLFSDWWD